MIEITKNIKKKKIRIIIRRRNKKRKKNDFFSNKNNSHTSTGTDTLVAFTFYLFSKLVATS
jgi:hypothetical protein